MDPDQPFRLLLIAGAVLVMPVVVYHRVRSQATREKLDRRQEGLLILLTLRPAGAACLLGVLAFMINPSSMAWSAVPLPAWLRWTGIALGAAAGALLVWTLRSLGKNLTDTVVTRREHTLVTTGPYRWVRHPFYDAVGLTVLANALSAANWFLLASGAILFVLFVVRSRTEERNLLARFGEPYRAYVERTGRFLPRYGVR